MVHRYSNASIVGTAGAYRLIEDDYEKRTGPYALNFPSLLARRARNLLEIAYWTLYCLKDKTSARTFYDDRVRDLVGLATVGEDLIAILQRMPITAVIAQASQLTEDRQRIVQSGKLQGIAYDETFMQISKAAQQLNDDGLFIKLNKLISKFAHPTAFNILTLLDQKEREDSCDVFLAIGATMFAAAFVALETYSDSN